VDLTNRSNYGPLSRGTTADTVYRVNGIESSVSTQDIGRCLSNLQDKDGGDVCYNIAWFDDFTFMLERKFEPPRWLLYCCVFSTVLVAFVEVGSNMMMLLVAAQQAATQGYPY
jgi:hypothetical protein